MTIFIIAEAGVNHNGQADLARKLVQTAHDSGADAIKFQSFDADSLATANAAKADYQSGGSNDTVTQREMLRQLQLDDSTFRDLKRMCDDLGLTFLSTPFDEGSLAFLVNELGVSRLKISSGDLTNGPLLFKAARTGLPIILSTGMGDLDAILDALGVLAHGYLSDSPPTSFDACGQSFQSEAGQRILVEKVTLLQCTTAYPTPAADINLRAIATLRERFGLVTGFSDHSTGITVPIGAAALGAAVIEKHFTLDRSLPGPDHGASLEPNELTEMVAAIRKIESALGDGVKQPAPSELGNRKVARRGIVARCPIRAGEQFTEANLTVKRPETGLSPMSYWDVLNQKAARDYVADEPIEA